MYSQTPPPPPPKPTAAHEASRMSTPVGSSSPLPEVGDLHNASSVAAPSAQHSNNVANNQPAPDPGDQWLPKFLEDKSKQDLADILSNHALLSGLTHSPQTAHPSVQVSHDALKLSLAANLEHAAHLLELEARLAHQRSSTQAQLLSTHALERQWRAKQAEMDHALAPFAPASLYQHLNQGVVEQEAVCHALEESFLEGSGNGDRATEREASEWVRKYREAKKLYYLRQEKKERWDEGRVGGWR
ncbi:hypothetical protein QBC37DRAFT_391532 [Rhypophila decipiens]|uniref:VPS37 C-terminal domain-containing protein n=1 Tax=Rhypophila decipiens TaxID=261697 RepID=A0AAN7B1B2_9PEZI|nr:hypothetical protein QBC37DRAFT_391532 [Rhypophila decipiens]